MSQPWLLEDPASKHNFKCEVCQSTLELGNVGKGAVVKHSKSFETCAKFRKPKKFFGSYASLLDPTPPPLKKS